MKIDFHTHTHHSYDCLMKPRKILKIAKKKGLDGIVINDHNTIKGGLEVHQLNNDENFTVIIGAEIATSAGDVTGIFLKEEIVAREVNEVVKEIKRQGGKVILNHPYKNRDLTKIDFSKIDFIEGYNGRLNLEENEKAIELAKRNNIPIIAGSDSHLYAEIASCATIVENITTLRPLQFEYKHTHQILITFSQLIKSFKTRKFKIFISAMFILLKYLVQKYLKLIKSSLK